MEESIYLCFLGYCWQGLLDKDFIHCNQQRNKSHVFYKSFVESLDKETKAGALSSQTSMIGPLWLIMS